MKKHPDDDVNDRGYREYKSVPYYDQVTVKVIFKTGMVTCKPILKIPLCVCDGRTIAVMSTPFFQGEILVWSNVEKKMK